MKATLIVSLFLTLTCCCRSERPDRYSYLPAWSDHKAREINWVVEQIDSRRWGNNVHTVAESIRDARETVVHMELGKPYKDRTGISEFQPKDGRLTWLYYVLDYLTNLSSDKKEKVSCDGLDAGFLIDILGQKYKGLPKLTSNMIKSNMGLMFEFLKYYAPEFYRRCLTQVNIQFEENYQKLRSDTEAKMDALVSSMAADSSSIKRSDEQLTEVARELDLAKGNFNATRMFLGIRQFVGDDGKKKCWFVRVNEYSRQLSIFTYEICDNLRSKLKTPFDVYNMAKILVSKDAAQLEVTEKFRKLNEYSRLCVPFNFVYNSARTNIALNMLTSTFMSMFK